MDVVITTVAGVSLIWAIIATIIALRSKTDVGKLAVENARMSSEEQQNRERLKMAEGDAAKAQRLEGENDGVVRELADFKDLLEKSERARKEDQENSSKDREALVKEIRALEADKRGVERDLENAKKNLDEQGDIVKEARESFKVLATQSLEQQQKSFMESASVSLKERQDAVEKLVKPLTEKIETLEQARARSQGELSTEIKMLAQQTSVLNNAMTRPEFRGQWAEIQVERVLELSGLKKGIDYEVQVSDSGGTRPDFVVRMPEGRNLVLDSKVSLPALQRAASTTDEQERQQALKDHATHVRKHADRLATQEYFVKIANSPEFVVMVIPDFAYQPAVERDSELLDRALNKKVIIVTPHMLFALLKVVERNWREQRGLKRSEEILKVGRQIQERMVVFAKHYASLGENLNQAVTGYNKGVRSWDTNLATSAMRFRELNVQAPQELPEIKPVDASPESLRKLVEAPEVPSLINGDGGSLSASNVEIGSTSSLS